MEHHPGSRFLQNGHALSTCFCPLDSLIQENGQPSVQEFEESLQGQLEEDGVPLEVKDTQEIDPADTEVAVIENSKVWVLKFLGLI